MMSEDHVMPETIDADRVPARQVGDGGGLIGYWNAVVCGEEVDYVVTSFGGEGRERLASISDAKSREAEQKEAFAGRPFRLVNWLMHPTRVESEEGLTGQSVRLVLIDDEGRTVNFVSRGAIQCLSLIVTVLGPGPIVPPLPVVFREVRTRKGYRTWSIIVQRDNPQEKA